MPQQKTWMLRSREERSGQRRHTEVGELEEVDARDVPLDDRVEGLVVDKVVLVGPDIDVVVLRARR